MHTSKSILIGALVLGAASVPAGVVVTDLGVPGLPAAPGPVVVEAPAVPTTDLRLSEPFGPIVLVPPAPGPVVGVLAPAPGEIRWVRPPHVPVAETLDEARLVRPDLASPGGSGRG